MKYKLESAAVNRMAGPVLMNYALNSVFSLLDEAIVGHYSVEGFALVGIAASLVYAITGALGILSAAFQIAAAEKTGKGDALGFVQCFQSGKILAGAIGGSFCLVSLVLGRGFFRVVYGLEGTELEELLGYFYPAAFTVVQNLLLFQYGAYFRNRLNTRISMYVTAVSTAVNLFFDYGLVYGRFGLPELGIAGAAWGSVIGLFCGLLVYQAAYSCGDGRRMAGKLRWRVFVKECRGLMALYPALLGQEFLEGTLFVLVVTGVVARMGTEEVAVYKLLDIVAGTIGLLAYAYATASQTYGLQNRAAGRNAAAGRYLKVGAAWGLLVTTALCILCAVGRETILGWILPEAGVISTASGLLGIVFLTAAVKVPYQVAMSYLQGAGQEQFVFGTTVAGTVSASALVVLLGQFWKLEGVYLAVLAEYAVLGWLYCWKAGNELRESGELDCTARKI